jgi:hypothetical protein
VVHGACSNCRSWWSVALWFNLHRDVSV